MTRSHWALSYSELYRNYNYDSLNYVVDVLDGFYLRYSEMSQSTGSNDPLEEKKKQMLRYEIIARFCQYTESLGGFIYGYRLNHLVQDKESKVLSTVSGYKVKEVNNEFKVLTKSQINRLWKNQEQSLEEIFGYHRITRSVFLKSKRESIYNIKKLLEEAYDCYYQVVGTEDMGSRHAVFANRGISGHMAFTNRGINVQTDTNQDQGCEAAGGTSGITNACTATSRLNTNVSII